jgi:2-keto-3-deoxy-6-phosphogluconate aldolase
MTVAAYVVDLMDRSKVSSAAGAAGIDVTFVRSATALADKVAEGGVETVVVDLSRSDAVDAVARLAGTTRIVAYGSHVDTQLLESAGRAGAKPVLARSAFFAEPVRWMRG